MMYRIERGAARAGRQDAVRWSLVVVCVALAWLMSSAAALAAEAIPTEQDPVAAARVVHISEQLRCLVCQNQTIADSNADLAQDLRREVRKQVAAGKSDAEIVAFMTDRYGDFVLYRPPFKPITVLLWGGPAILMLIGVGVLAGVMRKRRAALPEAALTAAEQQRAEKLLAGDTPRDPA
jgi:cytochrome c-type biogenesis protein CcmH